MSEVSLSLPLEVSILEGGTRKPIDIGRLSIAGFAKRQIYLPLPMRSEPELSTVGPMPLLVIDGQPAKMSQWGEDEEGKLVEAYTLAVNFVDNTWIIRSGYDTLVVAPATWKVKSHLWASNDSVKLFHPQIPYEQTAFKYAVKRAEEPEI